MNMGWKIAGLFILIIGAVVGFRSLGERNNSDPINTSTLITASPTPQPSIRPSQISPSPTATFKEVLLDVPFTSQAPSGNWDALHEEMCEESTVLMAYAWAEDRSLDSVYAEQELRSMAQWESDHFGTYIDTSAAQTAEMAQAVYGLKVSLLKEPSIEEIKKELDEGHILIMGMAGRMLHNPYFTPPGPIYHMIVIKGYDSTGFITNDGGTRRGNSYHYSYATLTAAAHDWNGDSDTLASSLAVAIVVSK